MQGNATGVANTTLKVFAGKGLHQPVVSFGMVSGMMHHKCWGMTACAKNQLALFLTTCCLGLHPELLEEDVPASELITGNGENPWVWNLNELRLNAYPVPRDGCTVIPPYPVAKCLSKVSRMRPKTPSLVVLVLRKMRAKILGKR